MPFNLNSLPKLPMVEMVNPSNDSRILNTNTVSRFFCMLSQSRRVGMNVSYVCSVLMDPLVNSLTRFSNIRNIAGAWNKVNSFHVIRVDRVLNRTKRIFNGPQRFERRGRIIPSKDMGNPICGPLNKWEMNLPDMINKRSFTGSLKGLEAMSFVVPFNSKNFKEMRFLLL